LLAARVFFRLRDVRPYTAIQKLPPMAAEQSLQPSSQDGNFAKHRCTVRQVRHRAPGPNGVGERKGKQHDQQG